MKIQYKIHDQVEKIWFDLIQVVKIDYLDLKVSSSLIKFSFLVKIFRVIDILLIIEL